MCARAGCATGGAGTGSSTGWERAGAVRGIAAGLHALVDVADEAEVLARAEDEGLAVGSLGEHWHERGEGRPQGLVVGYGTPRERHLSGSAGGVGARCWTGARGCRAGADWAAKRREDWAC